MKQRVIYVLISWLIIYAAWLYGTDTPTRMDIEQVKQMEFAPSPSIALSKSVEGELTNQFPLPPLDIDEFLLQCVKIDIANQISLQETENLIYQTLKKFRQQKLSYRESEVALQLAGFDVETVRKASPSTKYNSVTLISNKILLTGKSTLTPEEHTQFNKQSWNYKSLRNRKVTSHYSNLIINGDFDTLIDTLQNDSDKHRLLENKDILAASITLNNDLTALQLQQLLNAGLTVSLDALYQAITHVNALELLPILIQNSSPSLLNQRWRDEFHTMNLLMAALKISNVEVAEVFYSAGVSPVISRYEYSALDWLAKTSFDNVGSTQLLENLLADGVHPYDKTTQQLLMNKTREKTGTTINIPAPRWLSKAETIPKNINIQEIKTAREHINITHALANNPDVNFEQCKASEDFIDWRAETLVNWGLRLRRAPMKVDSKQSLKALSKLNEPLLETMHLMMPDIVKAKGEDENSTTSGRESIFENILEKSEIGNAFLLRKMVVDNASDNAILKQINKQGGIPDDFIHVLAFSGRKSLIETLIPMGLDIHALDDNGNSALYSAIKAIKALDLTVYLLTKNVTITNSSNLIGELLNRAAIGDHEMLKLLPLLKQQGLTITNEHRMMFVYIIQGSSPLYSELKTLFEFNSFSLSKN